MLSISPLFKRQKRVGRFKWRILIIINIHYIYKLIPLTHLEISQLGERVHDDTENDVKTDGGDKDEERQMKDDEESELVESVLCFVADEILGKNNVHHIQTQNNVTKSINMPNKESQTRELLQRQA